MRIDPYIYGPAQIGNAQIAAQWEFRVAWHSEAQVLQKLTLLLVVVNPHIVLGTRIVYQLIVVGLLYCQKHIHFEYHQNVFLSPW